METLEKEKIMTKDQEEHYEKVAGTGRKLFDENPDLNKEPNTDSIPLGKLAIIILGFLAFFALIAWLLIPGIFGG